MHAGVFGRVCARGLRVAQEKTVEEYLKREKVWAVAMAVIAVVFVVFATWYNLAIRPTL